MMIKMGIIIRIKTGCCDHQKKRRRQERNENHPAIVRPNFEASPEKFKS